MLAGRPAIATAYSGNLDYMTYQNSCLVGYTLTPVTTAEIHYNPGMDLVYEPDQLWAEADIDQAARWMRMLYEDPALRSRIGDAGLRRSKSDTAVEPPAPPARRGWPRSPPCSSEVASAGEIEATAYEPCTQFDSRNGLTKAVVSMSVWLQIVSQLLMLVVISTLGSGPVMLLSDRFELWVRLSLAPILGLTGTALFTTLEWFWSGNSVNFVVPVACVLSLGIAAMLANVVTSEG